MSIFGKIKKGLGIGTAKVRLEMPSQISQTAKEISGTIHLTAQSDQQVKSVKVRLVKKTMIGSGDEQRQETRDIETLTIGEPFDIKADETKTLPFTLPIDLGNSASFELFGGTLTVSSSDSNEKFEVIANVDLKDVALDPSAAQAIYFVDPTTVSTMD